MVSLVVHRKLVGLRTVKGNNINTCELLEKLQHEAEYKTPSILHICLIEEETPEAEPRVALLERDRLFHLGDDGRDFAIVVRKVHECGESLNRLCLLAFGVEPSITRSPLLERFNQN
jgi:hypothetical protein